jgi:hypothetical protein
MRLSIAFVFTLLGLALGGCERKDGSEPALTPASGQRSEVDRASDEITAARCRRELSCNDIWPDKTYETYDECVAALWKDTRHELDGCEEGIDDAELRECLYEIAEDGCDDPLGRFDRSVACKIDDVCQP